MLEAVRAATDQVWGIGVPRRVLLVGKLLVWPLILLALVTVALQLGIWRSEIRIAGPFAEETNPARHSLILTVPKEQPAPWWRQPLIGDTLEKPYESKLRVQIDGHEVWPAHTAHDLIREGTSAGYSHWGPDLIFSLPPGVKNAPETIITLYYKIRPRPWVTLALVASSLSLCWLVYHQWLLSLKLRHWAPTSPLRRFVERIVFFLSPAPYLILSALCLLGLVGSVLFVGSSLYALTAGWALPTTAPIRLFFVADWAARNEQYLGYLLLTLAGFGTLMSWLAAMSDRDNGVVVYEQKSLNLLRWTGFPIAISVLLLGVSAMWAGVLRPGDLHMANIGGLIPFNDAHGHHAFAFYQARNGVWTEFALRRPLAAAFRSVLLFMSNYSLATSLVLQAGLLACAACVASYAVMVWRGIWAGLAFFGLTYIYIRLFATTSLTEPLGLFWSLLSIPFFVDSFRSNSAKPALMGFAMTALALMTRMGSMFTIPALPVWLVWKFGRGISAKIKIAGLAICVLLNVFALNWLLTKMYGSAGAGTGSNFSYTLCGLTIGTGWDGCPAKLIQQGNPLQGDEAMVAKQLYLFAWDNFRANPEIFFRRLADNMHEFVRTFPTVMWQGYGVSIGEPVWLFRRLLTAICLIGLAYIFARRAKASEIAFWSLVWLSILMSSAVIYYDDGSRVLAASQPLMALFFAMGMGNPVLHPSNSATNGRLLRYGWLLLAAAAGLFLCVPGTAHHFFSQDEYDHALSAGQDEAFVYGGRRISGLLVVSDDQPLRPEVPAIHFTDFEKIVAQSGIESYHSLLHPTESYRSLLRPTAPPLPFGFVFAPRMERGISDPSLFVVPPDVLERHDVAAWRFELDPARRKPDFWPLVTKAEPWRLSR